MNPRHEVQNCWASAEADLPFVVGLSLHFTTKLGEDHLDTLISISNLIGYYDRLGESGKAAEIEEQC